MPTSFHAKSKRSSNLLLILVNLYKALFPIRYYNTPLMSFRHLYKHSSHAINKYLYVYIYLYSFRLKRKKKKVYHEPAYKTIVIEKKVH